MNVKKLLFNFVIASQLSNRDLQTSNHYASPPTVSNSCLPIYEQLNQSKIAAKAPLLHALQFKHPIKCLHVIIKRFSYSCGRKQPITLPLLWLMTQSFSHVRLGFLGGEPCRSMLSSVIKQWLFSPFQTTSCQGLWF